MMMRIKIIILVLGAMSFTTQGIAQQSEKSFVPGELLVLLNKEAEIHSFCADYSEQIGREVLPKNRIAQSMNLWSISFAATPSETETALFTLRDHPMTELAQLNHTSVKRRVLPDDADFSEQWSFYNDGVNGGSGLADISADQAWDITTGGVTELGDTIVVAVIDGGFNVFHEDLEANIFVNRNEIPNNNIDDDGNGYIDDIRGWNVYSNSGFHPSDNHGTHVAGTVGARGNNGIGVTGVSWNVKVLPVSGSSTEDETVYLSYGYVRDMRKLYNDSDGEKGAYVVASNSSFGVDYGDPAEYPLWCAMLDSMGMVGIVSAAATANLNIDIDQAGDVPTACASNFLLSVTNTTSQDVKNSGAAYGATTIDLGAPGTQIYSTRLIGYGNSTGTSMATPHVAGTIGLMYSAICERVLETYANDPAGLASFIRSKLLDEGVDELTSLQGLVATEGRLNLFKAVKSVGETCLNAYIEYTDSDCDSCNGSIDVEIVGGVPPYMHQWTPNLNSLNEVNVCAGSYMLKVTDATGDSIIKHISISDIGGPTVTKLITDVSCFGSNDGQAILLGASSFLWSDGSSNAVRTDLSAGVYAVTASNAVDSCISVFTIEMNSPNEIISDAQVADPVPNSAANGSVTLLTNGGNGSYNYAWSNGGVGATQTNLVSGVYHFTVTDGVGCSSVDSVVVGFPLTVVELGSAALRVFPNPVSQALNVASSENLEQIQIHDIQGKRVYTASGFNSGSTQLNTSGLASGYYVVSISVLSGIHRIPIQVVK